MATIRTQRLAPTIYRFAAGLAPKPEASFFICGCGHSGTTLLARILSTHPDVFSLPYETNAFLGDAGPNWRVVARMLVKAALSRKAVMVEKSPSHIHYTSTISRTIPRSKFIVATRDGRDTVASLGKRYDGNFKRAFNRWLIDSSASRERLAAGDSMLWRYEDFIDAPPDSLSRLCAFMGVPYSSRLLDYHKSPVDWGRESTNDHGHSTLRREQVNRPIEDNRGKWKTELPAEVAALFESVEDARSLMSYFGYR